ncbi:MAG: bifunctional adenosylcobinamide kinase/adenosylcobinamide-phosphate guanylyltransferase [Lachnospiraceae bacterium]
MELYVGGKAQGKLAYVKQRHESEKVVVVEGPDAPNLRTLRKEDWVVWHGFHLWVRERMEKKQELETMLFQIVDGCLHLSIISDEVGNGIVPLSEEEREYRETVGRLLCKLAEKADRMERIICGVGQKIK